LYPVSFVRSYYFCKEQNKQIALTLLRPISKSVMYSYIFDYIFFFEKSNLEIF